MRARGWAGVTLLAALAPVLSGCKISGALIEATEVDLKYREPPLGIARVAMDAQGHFLVVVQHRHGWTRYHLGFVRQPGAEILAEASGDCQRMEVMTSTRAELGGKKLADRVVLGEYVLAMKREAQPRFVIEIRDSRTAQVLGTWRIEEYERSIRGATLGGWALRIPLLPLTFALDVATSPIQLFLVDPPIRVHGPP